ncbi:hypothetical protein NQ314_015569 [Rhamnusium bicolor]|uniref:RUN and FYVE domain-containing protein 2 n=1 Tax=Rhamnusium bicolor TaxID=1586634 RepID=A0AAV8WYL0_9CUCU|nr:hypothetical protein NQ314_015569 [Rhamnusium bicolor]
MAAASSEGSPTTPVTQSNSSFNSERNVSRSPSLSSIKEFQWTSLLVSKPEKKSSTRKFKVQEISEGGGNAMEQEMAGAQDTIYLCNFRVSVDGEWLCLKELQDVEFNMQESITKPLSTPSPDVPMQPFGRDPVVIERSNLVNISKLVVKELIEQSLRYGRMLDSDHMPLQHFFIVLEHVLRHGLRPKKGLLGPKKELWDILQMVEKYASEAQDITASVRDLPTDSYGKGEGMVEVGFDAKKLADYLKVLIDHRDEALAEYFEPDALMLSDEAIVIIGLLVGLNVIDCNLCVKEEDLDCPQGVIDFSLYLRSSSHVSSDSNNDDDQGDPMTTVLDQKNYIEELNRHLNATVTNLQTKVESLTTTNALMKEDLAIAKNNLLALYEENRQLRQECGKDISGYTMSMSGMQIITVAEGESSNRVVTGEVEELKQRLEEERKLRQESDNELEIQMCLKAEMEVAMKLLEKDIHEKQDTIISLRRQLDDIKLINLEMYKKLQECEMELTQKGEMVSRLQAKAGQIGKILNNLEKYNHLLKDDKKQLDRKAPPDKRQAVTKIANKENIPKNVIVDSSVSKESCSSTESEHKEPISSDSTDSFVKLDLDLKSEEDKDSGLFQECEASLKHKTEFISKLEAKAQSMTDTIQTLENKYRESESNRITAEQLKREVDMQAAHVEEQANNFEGDLKVEREWRVSLQDTMQQDRERISKLQIEIGQLKVIAQKYAQLQEDYYTLKDQWLEQEHTLEELGGQLRESKLQISDLKEEINKNRPEGAWVKDNSAPHCKACNKEFNLTRRRHHCRNCGEIFCNACSENSMSLPSSAKPVRVCDECNILLVGRW